MEIEKARGCAERYSTVLTLDVTSTHRIYSRSFAPVRGRFAIVTDAGRTTVDAAARRRIKPSKLACRRSDGKTSA